MKTRKFLKFLGAIGVALATTSSLDAAPFGSAFTYQGRLNFSGAPAADGLYDFHFTLHDAAALGVPVGTAVDVNAVPVTNGLFTTQLDFGAPAFTSGEARWLQLEVNTNGVAPLAVLKPRQRLAPTPQAIYAGNAATAGSVADGAVTSAALAPGSVVGTSIADGSVGTNDLSSGLFNSTFWKLGGNAVFPPGTNFLGTLDFRPLEFRANNVPTLRLLPDAASPSLIGGHPANRIGLGVSGAFIGGGGAADGSNAVLASFASVVGGQKNAALGTGAFVGGGLGHMVEGPYSSIVGGFGNRIGNSDFAFVGGGSSNYAAWPHTVIGGGDSNRAQGFYAVIGGGYRNFTGEQGATVGGGAQNQALGHHSTIGGGSGNTADGFGSVVGGGGRNQASVLYAAVGGGDHNEALGTNSMVAGGRYNRASGTASSIGGGENNTIEAGSVVATIAGGIGNNIAADSGLATIAGGGGNITSSPYSAIGGGENNRIAAGSWHATIAGGGANRVATNSIFATIAGGEFNDIGTNSPHSAIGGGSSNNIEDNAQYATIPGGRDNTATNYAFAAGRRAKANHTGSFVWADDTDADFASGTNKQFAVRANNGVMIQSANTALDLRGGGGVRVAGAGVNTATPIFTHRATVANTSGSETRISHPHCNGRPGAILIVTYNYNPAGLAGTRNDRPVGIYYTGTQWAIYNLDAAAMPVGAAYNVLVANP